MVGVIKATNKSKHSENSDRLVSSIHTPPFLVGIFFLLFPEGAVTTLYEGVVEQAEEFQSTPSFFHLYTVVGRMRLSSILFYLFFAFYLFIFTFLFYFFPFVTKHVSFMTGEWIERESWKSELSPWKSRTAATRRFGSVPQ